MATSSGCNCLCTIHQPSSEVFHSFSKVMVLNNGRLFFFGAVSTLSQQLAVKGKGCPAEYNLADHTMFLLQTESDEVLAGLQDGVKLEFKEQTELNGDAPTKERQGTAGFFTQLSALTKREALGVWRNKP